MAFWEIFSGSFLLSEFAQFCLVQKNGVLIEGLQSLWEFWNVDVFDNLQRV